MKSSEFHELIVKGGWKHIRTAGSHYIYEKAGRTYPVPDHGAKVMGKGIEKRFEKKWGFYLFKLIKVKKLDHEKSQNYHRAEHGQLLGVC